jgi:hypothetical protein
MKTVIIDLIVILVSFAFTQGYTDFIKRKFGRKGSISASAKCIKDGRGRSPAFFWLFVVPLTIPMAYVYNNWLATIASGILFLIGSYTGYNPEVLKNNPLQNVLHVVFVNVAIACIEVSILFINPFNDRLINLWNLIPIGISIGIITYFYIKQLKDIVWRWEKVVIYQIYAVALFYFVALPFFKLVVFTKI